MKQIAFPLHLRPLSIMTSAEYIHYGIAIYLHFMLTNEVDVFICNTILNIEMLGFIFLLNLFENTNYHLWLNVVTHSLFTIYQYSFDQRLPS